MEKKKIQFSFSLSASKQCLARSGTMSTASLSATPSVFLENKTLGTERSKTPPPMAISDLRELESPASGFQKIIPLPNAAGGIQKKYSAINKFISAKEQNETSMGDKKYGLLLPAASEAKEQDRQKSNLHTPKEVAVSSNTTLEDYEEMPVHDFGKAMLLGMGWNPNKTPTTTAHQIDKKPRPGFMGLGADPTNMGFLKRKRKGR